MTLKGNLILDSRHWFRSVSFMFSESQKSCW